MKKNNQNLKFRYVDFVHVATYDYHTNTDLKTGHNAPLEGSGTGKDIKSTWTYLLGKGALPEKTILGVAFYGHTFNLVSKKYFDSLVKLNSTYHFSQNYYYSACRLKEYFGPT